MAHACAGWETTARIACEVNGAVMPSAAGTRRGTAPVRRPAGISGLQAGEDVNQKRLTNEEIAAYKLPKGTYFKVEPEHSDSPVTAAKAEAKGTTKDAQSAKAEPKAKEGGASNDRIAEKIDALKREVETVAAENRRLQDQITASAAQAAPQDRQPTAEQDPNTPRLSQ